MKFKKQIPYDILISPTPNGGFIVEVGCVKVVYSGILKLIQDLTEYLENPKEVEKQYNDNIAKPDRVHIRHIPDISVQNYGEMTNRQQAEATHPEIVIHSHKERSDENIQD